MGISPTTRPLGTEVRGVTIDDTVSAMSFERHGGLNKQHIFEWPKCFEPDATRRTAGRLLPIVVVSTHPSMLYEYVVRNDLLATP